MAKIIVFITYENFTAIYFIIKKAIAVRECGYYRIA